MRDTAEKTGYGCMETTSETDPRTRCSKLPKKTERGLAGALVLDRRGKRGMKKNVLAGKQQVKISIFKMNL